MDPFTEALQHEIEQAEKHEAEGRQTNEDMQLRARDYAEQRSNEQADSLIGRVIGPWTVIARRDRHETPSGKRAVYVIQHRDGFIKGLRGYRLNALIEEAQRHGIA